MKRKLISYDALKKMEEASISKIQEELINAEEVLANVLGADQLELVFFNESEAVYKTLDQDYVRTDYSVVKGELKLENIEELVVDEDSEKGESKKLISSMIDDLIENKDEEASAKLDEYLGLSIVRRNLVEGYKAKLSNPRGKRSKLFHKRQRGTHVRKRITAMMKTKRKRKGIKNYLKSKTAPMRKRLKGISNPRARVYVVKTMKEWNNLTENVLGYVNYKEMGPLYKECTVSHDDKGSVSAVTIPTKLQKNEGKILGFDWKTMDTEVKVLRSKAKKLDENERFARSVVEIKKNNNVSNNSGLETALENTVGAFPEVLYLTQEEMANTVKSCLEMAGSRNFDDNTCDFIAEAILRTAFDAYSERVSKMVGMAGVKLESTDKYVEFKDVANKLYSYVDASQEKDLRVFSDLAEALDNLARLAESLGDSEVVTEAKTLLQECIYVVNQEVEPDVQLAEFVANYLRDIYESNLNSREWETMDPVVSPTGDHPMLHAHAKQSYSPASDAQDRGVVDSGRSPVSDGKNIKNDLDDEMMNNGWGNIGGDSVYPSLSNPYLLKDMDFTMKGDKGVDMDNDDLGTEQGKDTWPNLRNPFAK
jgi:hypothetical protein